MSTINIMQKDSSSQTTCINKYEYFLTIIETANPPKIIYTVLFTGSVY